MAKEWKRGPARRMSAGFAALTFALLVFVIVSGKGGLTMAVGVLVVFALLALRASGLRRASLDVQPSEGHLKLNTEFEGPEEGDEDAS